MKAREEIAALDAGEGPLAKAAPNEPIFILRAQDRLAPSVVESWADLAAALGAPFEKVREARELAESMKRWQRRHGAKTPD